ncbi:hypothetical protein LTR99_000355 [Exophiala xenobiotica]|uniref:RRM domain-containing protein n=1 Tax=Vermiconidia calcicola TaxID=1690605 RepID=A0AAV9QIV3_9PEZI|nr:hypothetical protein H2202_004717 [Exophiala xenobiotica]KAK5543816.1 hypothetical protein LTR25_001431 [Vermiconidia calcicola]KAK5548494.1 hypothetical protein LTR23_001624 [Chaetothyriales sp. CCFEE 6169]KAK5213655.1 hypothetical protein LTR41_001235 [Exophiala xenobiotica]KAK5231329.1 hypothetical protein LTR72_000510 [Exophiala xenobiotica]
MTFTNSLPTPVEVESNRGDVVTIPLCEYESLIQSSREYLSLRQALLAGGAHEDNIDVLVNSNLSLFPPQKRPNTATSLTPSRVRNDWRTQNPFSTTSQTKIANLVRSPKEFRPKPRSDFVPVARSPKPGSETLFDVDAQEEVVEAVQEEVQDATRHEHRTLLLTGLPSSTTLLDLTKVVRGGAILQMYHGDGFSRVSFVDHAAAESFLHHAKEDGIYVKGQKVSVTWNDRQAYLSESLARRIGICEATRNLVIRFHKPYMTAESIRDDLEHIHNLEVVSIRFSKEHCFISLNAIPHALTARSCMHSRQKYKCVSIEFYPDECAQPIRPMPAKQNHNEADRDEKATIKLCNRFAALFTDSEG